MSISIEQLTMPVTFVVTRNKGTESEVQTTVNTTLDFSDYTADDFMNRAIDSVVIAIQSTLRNPPKDASKALEFSTLEGKTYKAPKPGKSASRKDPMASIATMLAKLSPEQRKAFLEAALEAAE
jgi:DNA-directed RNA polymerase specialized sigma24 family protein